MTPFTTHSPERSELLDLDWMRHGADWPRWQALAASAPPHLAPEFFALTRPLAGPGEALVAASWRAGELIGALPLLRRDDTLSALRSEHSPGYDYMGTPDGLDGIWRTISEDRHWSLLRLADVPADSPLATRLPALARRDGRRVAVRPGVRRPILRLARFQERMSPRFLTNLKRCERKAGGVELERLRTPSRADLDEAVAIEAMAWKGAAGTSIDADPSVHHVYDVAWRLFGHRGRASLFFLRAGGRRIAALFAVEDEHTLYAVKIGFDPAAASFSPGQLIIWKVAIDAEARGLEILDFRGREDGWKRHWTDEAREHVTVLVYQRSARGLWRWAIDEEARPWLRRHVRDRRTPLRRGCQRTDLVGRHGLSEALRARLARGLGIRSGLRRALQPARRPAERLGAVSRFAVGAWVRVRSEAEVRATLDDQQRLRGLIFVPAQLATCGRVYRVSAQVRRMRDDHGTFRPITRSVLLEGVDCSGGAVEGGCGRHCPLIYRDEWLEPAEAPRPAPTPSAPRSHARVRELDEIMAGLDLHGRRDGLTFMPEMAQYAGRRFVIAGLLTRVFEYDRWVEPRAGIYLLEGGSCHGDAAGANGPCDRACALLWHKDWLILEDEH